MIVIEGMPGAGKTTLLGRLLAALPGQVVIFPEAQPPPNTTNDRAIARALLAEDRARITLADKLASTLSSGADGLVVASDRCHLGVLAYRYALARSGHGSQENFEHALELCAESAVAEGHRNDTVIMLTLPVKNSLRRRAAHAEDERYGIWFDPGFLTAYNDFWATPPRDVPITGRVVRVNGADATGWEHVVAALPPAVRNKVHDTAPASATVRDELICTYGCVGARSPTVLTNSVHGDVTQLFPYAVHQRGRDGAVTCLRSAADLAAHAGQ
jgi:thymidylate kinase